LPELKVVETLDCLERLFSMDSQLDEKNRFVYSFEINEGIPPIEEL
jgi:hypothetical protein